MKNIPTQSEIMGLTQQERENIEQQKQQQMQMQEQNPFNSPEYSNEHASDTPINYGGGMADVLLSDNEIPEQLRKKYWSVFNKDNVLTFLDETRKKMKMMSFDISVIDAMNSMDSYDEYDFDMESQYNLVRNALDTKLDRAVGFKSSNMKNERIILQSQFSEAKQISEVGNQSNIKDGFFKRLLGRR